MSEFTFGSAMIRFAILLLAWSSRVESKTISLNNNWILKNETFSLSGVTIPSGVYSELESRGITESVLFSRNDVDLRWVGALDWTYELHFATTIDFKIYKHVALTFHGVDTIADVVLNGKTIGQTSNMFVRYSFDVKDVLKQDEGATNVLEVRLKSPIQAAQDAVDPDNFVPPECPPAPYNGVCHMNMLRKMQASFSWDWGPAVPSSGIWKPVVLELSDAALIRDVVVKIQLVEKVWIVDLWIALNSPHEDSEGILSAQILGLKGAKAEMSMKVKKSSEVYLEHLLIQVKEEDVEKWWPNGLGSQKLYTLHVQYEDSSENEVHPKSIAWRSNRLLKVGFRTIEVVEEPALNGLTFYFRVNGLPIFMKGSNYIPASIFPEKSADPDTVRTLMEAARDANMNMLRVWGGGLYESDLFYTLADEMGILIWQDMMFACAMYPAHDDFLASVRLETQQNVRRIQSHPSIAVWATNNENEAALRQNWYNTQGQFYKFEREYRKLYIETVKDEIEKNDPWRIVLNSSPGNGMRFENTTIAQNPQDYHYGDVHFYSYDLNLWDPRVYPRARFVSEYGFQSFPSHSSWVSTSRAGENLTQLLKHRQHFPFGSTPIDLLMEKNLPYLNPSDPDYWEAYIYFSQVSQAMAVKVQTNGYRVETGRKDSMQTMGALYWQLNDVWTAPSWSSIEFSGRPKILHNYITEIFQKDVVVVLINKLATFDVFVINEHLIFKTYQLEMSIYKYSSLDVFETDISYVTVPDNSVKMAFSGLDILKAFATKGMDPREYGMRFVLKAEDGKETLSEEFLMLTVPKETRRIQEPEVSVRVDHFDCVNATSLANASLRVTVAKPALFVYLLADKPELEHSRFSTNGFHQFQASKTVQLTYRTTGCRYEVRASDVKVMTLNQFMMK